MLFAKATYWTTQSVGVYGELALNLNGAGSKKTTFTDLGCGCWTKDRVSYKEPFSFDMKLGLTAKLTDGDNRGANRIEVSAGGLFRIGGQNAKLVREHGHNTTVWKTESASLNSTAVRPGIELGVNVLNVADTGWNAGVVAQWVAGNKLSGEAFGASARIHGQDSWGLFARVSHPIDVNGFFN